MNKRSEIITVRVLLGAIAILLAVSQQVLSQSVNESGLHFEDESALLEFKRSGGEGLGGVAWLDFDQDGDLDLFLTGGGSFFNPIPGGSKNGLFKNNGDGSFTNVSQQARVAVGGGNSGVVVGDIDNDGYPDIFLSGEGRVVHPFYKSFSKLLHNQRDGTFRNITLRSGIKPYGGTEWSAAMADINNDGYLDLFITSPGHIPYVRGFGRIGRSYPNKLYLNNGDLTFTDISQSAGITGLYLDEATGRIASDGACAVGFSDYNKDNLPDIFVANCNAFKVDQAGILFGNDVIRETPFNLYRNNGDHTFTDVASEAGLDILGFWMGIAFGDFDNDGHIDFFATSSGTASKFESVHALMHNNGDGTFTEITEKNLAETPFSWGTTAADFDNDGDMDLFKVGSLPPFTVRGSDASPGEFFRNEGKNRFVADLDATDIDLSQDYTTGVAQGDFNNDGFPDIVIVRSAFQTGILPPWYNFYFDIPNGQPVLLQNKGNSNDWLTVRLIGTTSNSMGIGARIELFSPANPDLRQVRGVRAGSSFASSESPWPTFGLGLGPNPGYNIKVSWPSGLVEEYSAVPTRQIYDVIEGSGIPQ
jgi:hypothetical protein